MKRKTKWWIAAAVVWIAILAALICQFRSVERKVGGLTLLEEAAAKLKDAGLFPTKVQPPTFTVGRKEVSDDDANELVILSPEAQWKGKARVSSERPTNEFPDYMLLEQWGKLWVYGDPELVREIV